MLRIAAWPPRAARENLFRLRASKALMWTLDAADTTATSRRISTAVAKAARLLSGSYKRLKLHEGFTVRC